MLALERVRGKFFTRAWGEFSTCFVFISNFHPCCSDGAKLLTSIDYKVQIIHALISFEIIRFYQGS